MNRSFLFPNSHFIFGFAENLPPHLAELDRKMQRKKSESPKPVDQQIPVEQFSDRINVFDGDEFDVNSRAAIDKSKVHRGKKKFGAKNANALLDDKKDLSGNRNQLVKRFCVIVGLLPYMYKQ